MRPPTRNSVRHPPSVLQPQAVEGAARQGTVGMPAPIQSLEDGQPRAPPRPALSVQMPHHHHHHHQPYPLSPQAGAVEAGVGEENWS